MNIIKTILISLLLTSILYPQKVNYISMIAMEIGSSTKDVKSKWVNSELSSYGFLKTENNETKGKHTFLLYRDMNEEFTFNCNYTFIEDSLFSTVLTNHLNLDEANDYVRLIKDNFYFPIEEGNWKLETFNNVFTNIKDGSSNKVSFGVEPQNDKVKFSISITNLRMSDELSSSLQDFPTKNDSLNGFLDIMWKSSKESVIERMKSYNGVKLDTICDYRIDFVGGTFNEVKVKRWVFAFDNDRFYNLLIEFDSKVGSNDFSKLEKYLIEEYGSEYNYHIVYEDKKEVYMKDLTWYFYYGKENTFIDNPRKMIANIHFRGCCDEDNPQAMYVSYTYVPISKYGLPKRPLQIVCPPTKVK